MTQITILEGATFCVSDEFGDLGEPTTGFFDSDTRFLSRLRLTVNGARPLLLSQGKVEYFSSVWFLRNPAGRRACARTRSRSPAALRRRRDAGARDPRQPRRPAASSSSWRSRSARTSPTSSRSRRSISRSATPLTRFRGRAGSRLLRRGGERVPVQRRRRVRRPDPGAVSPVRGEVEGGNGALPGRARATRALAAADRRVRRAGRRAGPAPRAAERHFGDEIDRIRASPRGLAAQGAAAAGDLGRPRDARSGARCRISPRCGCAARACTGSCPRRACRGSWPCSAGTR